MAYDWRVVDGNVYQLVSLDQEQHLKMWRVDPSCLKAVGHVGWKESAEEGEMGVEGRELGGGGGVMVVVVVGVGGRAVGGGGVVVVVVTHLYYHCVVTASRCGRREWDVLGG